MSLSSNLQFVFARCLPSDGSTPVALRLRDPFPHERAKQPTTMVPGIGMVGMPWVRSRRAYGLIPPEFPMNELVSARASDIPAQPIRWLWPGRIPRGKVTLLAGDPGLGKSFVTLDIAARVTRGGHNGGDWPDCPAPDREPGDVIILNAEDDWSDTIRPRLEACGADLSRITLVEGVHMRESGAASANVTAGAKKSAGGAKGSAGGVGSAGGAEAQKIRRLSPLALDRDLDSVGRLLHRMPQARLVIIDPISAYMGDADSNNNAEVRAVLGNLGRLAMASGVAVLCVTHLNKGSGASAGQKIVYRAMGSLAFTAAARMVWYISKYAGDANVRAMTLVKNNVGAPALGMTFDVERVSGESVASSPTDAVTPPSIARVRWLTADLTTDADAVERDQEAALDAITPAVKEAAEFLRDVLRHGPTPAARVIRLAMDAHISMGTLRRAREVAGVCAERASGNDPDRPWTWRLVDGGAGGGGGAG